MFILRQIAPDGTEFNHVLGEEYQLITDEQSPSLFEEIVQTYKYPINGVRAFVIPIGGSATRTFAITMDYKNYIMTESGKTFCNLTYHNTFQQKSPR